MLEIPAEGVIDIAYPHPVEEFPADPVAAAGVLEDAQAELIRAEIRQMLAVAHLCDLHPGPETPAESPAKGEMGRQFGDEGTPVVSEFLSLEIGPLLGISPTTASMLIRDVLNLRHRHPRLWQATCLGQVRVWQARKIAQRVAREGVSLELALEIDAVHSPMVEGNAWPKVMRLLDGVIAMVDPAGIAERDRVRRAERYVRTRRSETMGMAHLWARAETGDVAHLDAMIDRLAEIQADLAGADHDREDDHQAWRSKALGVLANPAQALALLKQSATNLAAMTQSEDIDDEPNLLEQVLQQDFEVPEALIAAYRPKTTVVVHIAGVDLARLERWGWLQSADLGSVLRGSKITVQPVIDLNANLSSEAYEVPESIKKQIRLRNPVEAYPYSDRSASGRGVDTDHTIPWPRGVTESKNLAPLGRGAHRGKTHGGYGTTQLEAGIIDWMTPLGYRYQTGSRRTLKRRPANRSPGTTRTTVGAVVHTLALP